MKNEYHVEKAKYDETKGTDDKVAEDVTEVNIPLPAAEDSSDEDGSSSDSSDSDTESDVSSVKEAEKVVEAIVKKPKTVEKKESKKEKGGAFKPVVKSVPTSVSSPKVLQPIQPILAATPIKEKKQKKHKKSHPTSPDLSSTKKGKKA